MEFYPLLEKLVAVLNSPQDPAISEINSILTDMCRLFHVEKGEVTFYRSPTHERLHRGETFVCYDSGVPGVVRLTERSVTPSMMIGSGNIYCREDAAPWSAEEESRVRLVMNTVLSFMMRRRLNTMVEMLTFLDDDGYHNTRYYLSQMTRLGQSGQLGGKAAARFNLKHFSLVNQQIGRAAGDLAMRNYCGELENAIGPDGILSRLGGDNFVLLCDDSRIQDVIRVFNGLPVACDMNSQDQVFVSAIAGILMIPQGFEFSDSGDIMDKITSTYQNARRSHNEDIVYCSDDLLHQREHVMRIQNLFPLALEREEFMVYYQPKIDVFGNELKGAEALCRWFHDGRIVPPAEFIPVLEQNLDICRLDFYMLEHVCMDLRRWLDEGKQVVRVSVNLSRRHMLDAQLFEHIIRIVDKYNVPHQYIEIELTETTTDVEFRDLKRIVSVLQNAGIYTSVDDFGIGYSSLNLIRAIPWNVLKVDKSILPTEQDDEHSRSSVMFRHVVAMAHEMGLECVAEGVETPEQIDVLKKNCCHIAQGFYYDKPLPVSEFEDRLLKHVYRE